MPLIFFYRFGPIFFPSAPFLQEHSIPFFDPLDNLQMDMQWD